MYKKLSSLGLRGKQKNGVPDDYFSIAHSLNNILGPLLYVSGLLFFAHISFLWKFVSDPHSMSFMGEFISYNANFAIFIANAGLLLFVMLDTFLFGEDKPLRFAGIVCLCGLIFGFLLTLCALGCKDGHLKDYGAIDSEIGCVSFLTLYCITLVYLKYYSFSPKKEKEQ